MFEDDGCAAFGSLAAPAAVLGPVSEVDGESVELLRERWASRYGVATRATAETRVVREAEEEKAGSRIGSGMTSVELGMMKGIARG